MAHRQLTYEERKSIGSDLWRRYGVTEELQIADPRTYDARRRENYGAVATLMYTVMSCFRREDTNSQMLRDFLRARTQMEATEQGLNSQTTRPNPHHDF